MKGDLKIALEINENISLAKRLAGQLNVLVKITGYGEKKMLQNAVKCVELAITACAFALDDIDDRANTGIRMDRREDGRDETD